MFNQFINQLPKTILNNFFFIQIGGFDGIFDDPIHDHINKYKWSGIIIEPQPDIFQKLKSNYQNNPNIKFINAAVSVSNEPIKLYRIKQNTLQEDWKNCFATVCQDRGDIGKMDLKDLEILTIPGITLSEVIKQNNLNKINLLQIDTEGYDYQIIKSIDFSLIKPEIIHYEHRHLKKTEIKKCHTLLESFNYKIKQLKFDTIAYQ